MTNLIPIYQECFNAFRASLEEHYGMVESIPIAYFGDLSAYQQSEKRVVTVGLNPSDREFPALNPYLRFPHQSYQQLLESKDWETYERLLCQYYQKSPYLRWFSCFTAILKGLNASYLNSAQLPNRVIHTNICSPIATNPTWSKLNRLDKSKLFDRGQKIWHSLIEALKPDLILISVAERYLETIQFQRTDWEIISAIADSLDGTPRKRLYQVKLAQIDISPSFTSHICFGRAAHTPFGSISNAEKFALGKKLLIRITI